MNLEDCLAKSTLDDKAKRKLRLSARSAVKSGLDQTEAARKAVAEAVQEKSVEIEALRDELAARGHQVDIIPVKVGKQPVRSDGMLAKDVQEFVDGFGRGLRTDRVRVVQSYVDLPNEVLGRARFDISKTSGLHDPKTDLIYIISSNVSDYETLFDIIVHESVHRGIEVLASEMGGDVKKSGDKVLRTLDLIYQAHKEEIGSMNGTLWEGKLDFSNKNDRRTAANEFVAQKAEGGSHAYWVHRLVGAVRDFLRRVLQRFGKTLAWTEADTMAFLVRARDASRRNISRKNLGDNPRDVVTRQETTTGDVPFHSFKNPMTRLTEDQRSFALQVHGHFDRAMLAVNVKTKKLQDKVMELTGVDHITPAAKRLDMAMLIYRDLKNSDAVHVDQAKRQPVADRVADFKAWAATELPRLKGEAKLQLQEMLRDLEQAQNLTQEQRDFVDNEMDAAFAQTTGVFMANGKLKGGGNENYVYRKLTPPDDRPTENSGAPSEASGPVKSHSSSLMRRKYPTILDAFRDGYRLAPEVRGITNSWKEVTTDAVKIEATKRFLQDGMSIGVFSTKNPGDWVEIKAEALKVWRPIGNVKTVIRDTPHLNDVLAAKDTDVGSFSRKIFVTEPEAVWAVYPGQNSTRAAGLFDNEADARLFAQQFKDPKVAYRENVNVFGKVPVFAPAPVAEAVNRMTAPAGGLFRLGIFKGLSYLNGTLKPWMLWGDFFHHQSLMRSWTFGGPHDIIGSLYFGGGTLDAQGRPTANVDKGFSARIVGMLRGLRDSVSWRKAMLSGLELIEEKNPIIQKLAEKGLTFPTMADMTGHNMTRAMGIFETLMRAMGSQKAADMVEAGKIFRQRSEHWLFGTLDAGLKAQWAYGYFMHQLRHELARGGTPDVDRIAEVVADAANTAFGGQHAGRAGRNKDLQKLAHLLFLAPDWALTQIKPAFVAMPGMPKLMANIFNEMPPPPGQQAFYRKLIAKQIMAAMVATLVAQVLINGGSDEGPWELYREQMKDWRTFARLRWAMVDITRFYHGVNSMREGLGLEPIEIEPGTRMMFNMPGFIVAPLRLFELGRFIMAKGSPAVRIIAPYVTGSDWRNRPYKTAAELVDSVAHPDRKASPSLVKGVRDENPQSIAQWPAILMANVRDMQPQQVGQLLRWLQGEEDGLSAAMRGMGVDVAKARDPKAEYAVFREIQKLSQQEFGEIRRAIFRNDYDPNKLSDRDIDAYVAVGMRKAIRQTDMKAAQLRMAMDEAKLNPQYTPEARRRRLELLRKTEEQVYRNITLHYSAMTEAMKRHSIRVSGPQIEAIRKELEGE